MDQYKPDSGRRFYAGLLEALIEVMGTSRGYLFHHGPRVALAAYRLAERLDCTSRERSEIFFAAVLQDLGMIGLVEDAWENPVPVLREEQRALLVEHPIRSEATVTAVEHLESISPLIRHHHEWWDGSGYPDGLSGPDIPRGARILRVVDTAVALSSDRPQRAALKLDEVMDVIRTGVGTEFGPEEAEAFAELAKWGAALEFHPALFHRATSDAAAELIPSEVSPLSTRDFLDIVASLIDAKDPYTAGHSRRVAQLSCALATELGLDEWIKSTTWAAGYLHDLGKVGVPLSVLAKKGSLDRDERTIVEAHAPDGAEILASIPALKHLSPGARYHHERWDGAGYPEGLSGNRIPIIARILSVCDAYDAMTSKRAYRSSRSHDDAMAEIRDSTGSHFCPDVADAFGTLPRRVFEDLSRPERRLRHWLSRPIAEWRGASATAR